MQHAKEASRIASGEVALESVFSTLCKQRAVLIIMISLIFNHQATTGHRHSLGADVKSKATTLTQ